VERDRRWSYGLAKRALAIAPNLAEAHVALSRVYEDEFQFADELRELKLAAKLAPGDATVQAQYSNAMRRIGNMGEAFRLSREALKLDPLNSQTYLLALFSAHQYQDAVEYARKFPLEKPPAGIVGDSLLLLGRFKEAEQSYAMLPPDDWRRLTGEAILALRRNDRAAAIKLAALKKSQGDAGNLQYAEIYAQMAEKGGKGDMDRAFGALNRAFEVKDSGLTKLKIDPFLDPLRSDPRFAAVVKKMNFPSSIGPFYETWVKFLVPWPASPEGGPHE
jgi:tetratricopeptide (TPR) repeat protein